MKSKPTFRVKSLDAEGRFNLEFFALFEPPDLLGTTMDDEVFATRDLDIPFTHGISIYLLRTGDWKDYSYCLLYILTKKNFGTGF